VDEHNQYSQIAQEGTQENRQRFFSSVQSMMAARRAQHRLNFKPLPHGHGSLRSTGGRESTARWSDRLPLSMTTGAWGLGVDGKLRAPTVLTNS
jgi:hypothetical protein